MWSAGRPFGINVFIPKRAFKHDFLWILTLDFDEMKSAPRFIVYLGACKAGLLCNHMFRSYTGAQVRLDESFWDDFLGNHDFRSILPAVIHDIQDSASFSSDLESLSSPALSLDTNQISRFSVRGEI